MRVSVIIPSRNEQYLNKTISDVFNKAAGDVEVVAVIDGPTDHPLPIDRPGMTLVINPRPLGFRCAVNQAVAAASGEWLMKLDGHCMVSQDWDEVLKAECDMDWLMVGRRHELDVENWSTQNDTPVDYFYLSCPWTSPDGYMRDYRWVSRAQQRADVLVDETMTISGSMWFMSKDHYINRIRTMYDEFGHFGEPQELCCKTWMSGGRVMVNKKMLHAHLRAPRKYSISWPTSRRMYQYVTQYWSGDKWPYQINNFGWIVDHFWPLPMAETRVRGEKYVWEQDWRKYYHA